MVVRPRLLISTAKFPSPKKQSDSRLVDVTSTNPHEREVGKPLNCPSRANSRGTGLLEITPRGASPLPDTKAVISCRWSVPFCSMRSSAASRAQPTLSPPPTRRIAQLPSCSSRTGTLKANSARRNAWSRSWTRSASSSIPIDRRSKSFGRSRCAATSGGTLA